MSKILCIIDGMNDSAFCAEKYPALASFPEQRFIKTVPDGFEAETLPCVLSLLGINPPPRYIRGWIEALGAGIDVNPDDLIFRGSWVSLDGNGVCTGFCDAPYNIPELKQARYLSLNGYKNLLIFPGYASYAGFIKSVLPFELLGKCVADSVYIDIPLLKSTLEQINNIDPARAMIPWAASAVQVMPDLSQSAAVCGANVVKGIAKALNMKLIATDEMTGDTDTDLKAKLRTVLELAEEYPFVLLHIGGCDEAAHRMDREEKETFLSRIDETVISTLLLSDHTIEVASDHGSDSATGKHIGGKQPFFVQQKA